MNSFYLFLSSADTSRAGQNHICTVYIRIFGTEITKYAVFYGVYVQFWPTLTRTMKKASTLIWVSFTFFWLAKDNKDLQMIHKITYFKVLVPVRLSWRPAITCHMHPFYKLRNVLVSWNTEQEPCTTKNTQYGLTRSMSLTCPLCPQLDRANTFFSGCQCTQIRKMTVERHNSVCSMIMKSSAKQAPWDLASSPWI